MNQIQQALSPNTKQKIMYGTGCAYELTKGIIVVAIVITLIHFFIATIAIVDGISMEPNFHTGDYLIVDRWDYNFGKPARGDAVVLRFPGDPDHKKYIKRIIGLPGEHIKIADGQVFINDKLLNETYIPGTTETTSPSRVIDEIVKPDEYFVMGDNRMNSNDSRIWDTAGSRFLIGKAWIEVWPKPKQIEKVNY
ncbi:MAG: signal peptidase I [Candidatus Berkelbacteria bacterium]